MAVTKPNACRPPSYGKFVVYIGAKGFIYVHVVYRNGCADWSAADEQDSLRYWLGKEI